MDLPEIRRQLCEIILDMLEVLTGEELVTFVTRDDEHILTPWVMYPNAELIEDTLNGWMDNSPWNSPKSL